MKTTLYKAIMAYNAIAELENEKTDFSTAHALIMAKKALEPHAQFYIQSERTIVEKYALPSEDGSKVSQAGKFRLPAENAAAYTAEKAELNGVEVDIDLNPRRLKSVPDLKPSTLEALLDVGVFEFMEE